MDRQIDILCISETWLLPNMTDKFINIPQYKVFRQDVGRGGGVCIYVRDYLSATLLPPLNNDRPPGVEVVWCTIQLRKMPSIIVGCMYRHPKATHVTFDYLQETLRLICLKKKVFYLLGDLNDDYLCKKSKLRKIVGYSRLSQIIEKPTRITLNSATLLDVIITNNMSDTVISSVVLPCPVADHDLISATINLRKDKPKNVIITNRCLKDYSPKIFCDLLHKEHPKFRQIFLTDDIDVQTSVFTKNFVTCLDQCAPTVTRELRRPPAPWLSDEILHLMNVRNMKQKALKLNRHNIILQQEYKILKTRVKNMLSVARNEFYKEKLNNSKGNSSAMWKLLNELIPNKDKNSSNVSLDNKTELFNDFFANVGRRAFEESQQGTLPTTRERENHFTNQIAFRPQPVDSNTIILTIKHLKETKATGSDGISLKFLKDALPAILPYITCMVNTSIVTGSFPAAWKHAIVIPLHKKGDTDDVSNYRPISLLPVISKIIEKIIATQLTHYLESNFLLSSTQHGFRPRLSTETALLHVSKHIYEAVEKKEVCLLTLCDLSKAFDSVSHDILLRKCNQLGIDKYWFESYLNMRTQSVRIGKNVSSPLHNYFGVPQGSILGPILFNIYVNDLSDKIKECFLVQYADDTQFILTGNTDNLPDLIHRAEMTLSCIQEYFTNIGLLLNSKKTQCIFIGSRSLISRIPEDITVSAGDTSIKPSMSVRNLGVHFDRYMLFDVHISEMIKKVSGILMFINRLQNTLNKDARLMAVQTLALSHLNYGINIWGTCNTTQLTRVQKIQNFAARIVIGGCSKFDHVTPLLKELQWLTINKKCIFEQCLLGFKVIKKHFPEWLVHFPFVRDINNSATRQRNTLYTPRTHTDFASRTHQVRIPQLWNKLPEKIKESTSLHTMKSALKKYLMNNDINI